MGLLFRGKSSRRLFSSPRCHFRVWFRLKTETEDASGERESCIPQRSQSSQTLRFPAAAGVSPNK